MPNKSSCNGNADAVFPGAWNQRAQWQPSCGGSPVGNFVGVEALEVLNSAHVVFLVNEFVAKHRTYALHLILLAQKCRLMHAAQVGRSQLLLHLLFRIAIQGDSILRQVYNTLVQGTIRGLPVLVDPVYGFASYKAALYPDGGNSSDAFTAVCQVPNGTFLCNFALALLSLVVCVHAPKS